MGKIDYFFQGGGNETMIFILIISTIFIADYIIKQYIEENKELHKTEEILGGKIRIEKYHNKGAILNFLDNMPNVIKVISSTMLGIVILLFAIMLPKKGNNMAKLGLSFFIGGALNNVYDRIKRGYVVDYFSFKSLKTVVFNFSDFCIFFGSFLLCLTSLFKKK